MVEVSDEWRDNQQQTLVSESFVEITMDVTDPQAQDEATATDNGHTVFSGTSRITRPEELTPNLYATLELNSWVLDGTRKLVPDSAPYGDNGYVGDAITNRLGGTWKDQIITIKFPSVITNVIPGIVITWSPTYGEYAYDFIVVTYKGSTKLDTVGGFSEGETVSTVYYDFTNFDKIEIKINFWSLPSHRVRVEKIQIGIEKTYTKSDIISFKNSLSCDPISSELPKSEIVFEIKNLDGEYNPYNEDGLNKYLTERQKITVRYGYKLESGIEWIPGGTYYLSGWETPQNGITATFTARDALEYMNGKFQGGDSVSGIGFGSLVKDAITQAELPSRADGQDPFVLSYDVLEGNYRVPDGVDLSDYTIAEVLQLVANAAQMVFYQDRDGILHIEEPNYEDLQFEINQFNSYKNSELELTKRLKEVNINNGAYVGTFEDTGETQSVNNPLIDKKDEYEDRVANWIYDFLRLRKKVSGEFRADPRIDPLNLVGVVNQFSGNYVLITSIEYTYNGAFKGTYEGRVFE